MRERASKDIHDVSILAEIRSNISTLRGRALNVDEHHAREFDHQGTELWNLSSRLKRDDDSAPPVILGALRVFAFSLLDCPRRPSHRSLESNVRIFKAANKVSQQCLDLQDHEHAQSLLSSAAACDDAITRQVQEAPAKHVASETVRQALEVEYLTLRIMLVSTLI